MNLDTLVSVIFLTLSSAMLLSRLVKSKSVNTSQVLSFSFHAVALFMGLISLGFFQEFVSFSDFVKYRSFGFITLQSLLVATVGMLAINELNSKKIKTLWRVPVIGLLVGLFDVQYHRYVVFVLLLIILFILLKNTQRLRILTLRISVHLLLSLVLVILEGYEFWLTESLLILILLNIYPLWDMLLLKQKMARNS